MWKWILMPLILFLTLAGIAQADSPAMPTSYTKGTGDFVFVMLANDDQQPVSSTGKPYPSSGLYRNDGSITPLWTVDFYAFDGQVFLSPDGHHAAHLGPWPPAGDYAVLAVAFYKDGQLLQRYSVADLVKNPTALPRSESHYTWQKEPAQFDATANQLTLTTHEDQTYRFDLTTGQIVNGAEPPSRGLHTGWWVGGTLALLVGLWFISRRRA